MGDARPLLAPEFHPLRTRRRRQRQLIIAATVQPRRWAPVCLYVYICMSSFKYFGSSQKNRRGKPAQTVYSGFGNSNAVPGCNVLCLPLPASQKLREIRPGAALWSGPRNLSSRQKGSLQPLSSPRLLLLTLGCVQ